MFLPLLAVVARILTSCLANWGFGSDILPIHMMDILGSQTRALGVLLMVLARMLVSAMIKGLNHVLRRESHVIHCLAACLLRINYWLHHIGQVLIPVTSLC